MGGQQTVGSIADGYIQGGSTLVICVLFAWMIIKTIPSVLTSIRDAITEFRAESDEQREDNQSLINLVRESLSTELVDQRKLFSATIEKERDQRDAERQEYRVELAAERKLRAAQQEAFLKELAEERKAREEERKSRDLLAGKFEALANELFDRRLVPEHPMHPDKDLHRRRENHHEGEHESG